MDPHELSILRELAARSRRTQRTGALALLACLLLLPFTFWASEAWPGAAWALPYGATLAGGLLLVAYAKVAGEERGAYRRVFKEAKKARRVAVEEERIAREAPVRAS